jgi:hypothetical protein
MRLPSAIAAFDGFARFAIAGGTKHLLTDGEREVTLDN